MRTISIRLPDSLHRQLRALAARDGVSINQLVVLALTEKVFALKSDEDPQLRAAAEAGEIHELFPGIIWPGAASQEDGTPS